ncbi:MAG: hypothetical protein Q9184_007190, partial [Pyrenodesmia sp. 2 TL-2023]
KIKTAHLIYYFAYQDDPSWSAELQEVVHPIGSHSNLIEHYRKLRGLYDHYKTIIETSVEADADHMAWRQQMNNIKDKVEHLLNELIMIKGEVSRFHTLHNGNGWVDKSYYCQFPFSEVDPAIDNRNGNLCSVHLMRSNGDFQTLDQFMASFE